MYCTSTVYELFLQKSKCSVQCEFMFRTVRLTAPYSAPKVVPYSINMKIINGLIIEIYGMFYTIKITNIPTMSHKTFKLNFA